MTDPLTAPPALIKTETDAAQLSPRAQSKAANRQKILESALRMFGERGYEASTLRDIAKEAGLSTGAVFANFADKREIFFLIVNIERAHILSLLDQAYDETVPLPRRLNEQFHVGFQAGKIHRGMFLSAIVLQWNEPEPIKNGNEPNFGAHIRLRSLHCLNRAIERGEIPASAPIEIAATILEDVCIANLRRAYFREIDEATLMKTVAEHCDFICQGLGYK